MEFAAGCGHSSNAPAAECTWGASGEVGEKKYRSPAAAAVQHLL